MRYIHLKRTHLIIVKMYEFLKAAQKIPRCGLGIMLCGFFVLQTLTEIQGSCLVLNYKPRLVNYKLHYQTTTGTGTIKEN